ncbi:MAG: TetR family transcriptional regulator [Pseudonocardia sp. SCN 73-27]|uniref:TetR/AcrR family transcriptional regulator n=1 Tax=unclassified Pseudonocardia TaxID=2619320 RepID=UPI00086EEAB6|nr:MULTISPECIES: TetR/AcrR family transcriptional regulator [unclassified Pseudonocardia]ODU23657.1 MAG: TetR family transcriptional regulator [Pseudonocardia sp. SCN 72-51]ODV07887.1 MAG: TetR family transcriptional regulator [Pseudonocardia sp. SCN 73-27]
MTAGRRRGVELERAILRAAAEELVASGYAGMTMDKVARRAGTNKNAIYRRWPQRAALGVAAYKYVADARTPTVDTGTLRRDALELLRQANASWSSPHGAVLRDLLAAAADEPALLDLLREQAGGGALNAAWFALLSRAVARGEAPPEAVQPRVAALPMTLLRGEYALRGVPALPDEVLVEIIDEIFLPLIRGRGLACPVPLSAG